jgi:hypothetical protein
MSAYQVGCRLARYHQLLQWFICPPLGTIFSAADICSNNILLSITVFLNNNWNLWGGEETRHLCRIGDLILDAYSQQEVVDLTSDDDDEDLQMEQDWVVLDELHEDDLPEPDTEESEDEAPDMLFDMNNLLEEDVSEFDSHSESDYSTSESEDSGIEE